MSNISDDDQYYDHDVSDDGEESDRQSSSRQQSQYYSQADKRAHHNALERKRRDHIKDSFTDLRDAVPYLQKEKASRAQILKKSAEYIINMKKKNEAHKLEIEDLLKQNRELERYIKILENMQGKATYEQKDNWTRFSKEETIHITTDSDDSDESTSPTKQKRTKKMKHC